MLDYYTGILFLTTNRPGALDEAFKSRIHYKIYYPSLTKEQAIDIWRLNIQRLRRISEQSREKRPLEIYETDLIEFAGLQYDDCNDRGVGHWNGRQIRNAFQVARSLAYYDSVAKNDQIRDFTSNELPRPAVLHVKYFQMMHEITESFDQYMLEVFSGKNDKDLAFEMEHRADHWTSDRSIRKVHLRPEHDDQYGGSNPNGRSSFDFSSRQEFSGRPRNVSHPGDRVSISVPGSSQRSNQGSLAPPLSAAYDESIMDDKIPNLLHPVSPRPGQRRPSQPAEGPMSEFRRTSAFENEYISHESKPGSGLGQTFATPELRAFGRNSGSYGAGRDARSHNEFDNDKGYRREANEHGKRERV